MTTKRATRQYMSTLKKNMIEEAGVDFRLKKVDETRNYLLE